MMKPTTKRNPVSNNSLSGGRVPSTTNSNQSEEMLKMQQDLELLARKLNDLSSQDGAAGSSIPGKSQFVSGIRSSVEIERQVSHNNHEAKLHLIENIIARVIELDREVLRLTDTQHTDKSYSRRQSRGMDLYSIPTHLHVVDRLLDFHVQNKRANVTIHQIQTNSSNQNKKTVPIPTNLSINGESINSPHSPSKQDNLNAELEKLKREYDTNISQLKIQLHTTENEKNIEVQKVEKYLTEIESYRKQLEIKNSQPSQNDADEIKKLQSQIHSLQSTNLLLEERCDILTHREQIIVTNLLSTAKALSQDLEEENQEVTPTSTDSLVETSKDMTSSRYLYHKTTAMPEQVQSALQSIREASFKHLVILQTQIDSMNNNIQELNNELSSLYLQKDYMNNDMMSLLSEHEALKGAYHSLEMEAHESRTKLLSSSKEKVNLEKAQEVLDKTLADLHEANIKITSLYHIESHNKDLERRLSKSELERHAVEIQLRDISFESQSYKTLAEALKNKLKEALAAGGNSNSSGDSNNRQFLDTFEEVMREEMMTMKVAFEAKLKAAKDEVDALSKRNQTEALRMQNARLSFNAGNTANKSNPIIK